MTLHLPDLVCDWCGRPLAEPPASRCKQRGIHACSGTLRGLLAAEGVTVHRAHRITGIPRALLSDYVAGRRQPPYWVCRLVALELGLFWPLGPDRSVCRLIDRIRSGKPSRGTLEPADGAEAYTEPPALEGDDPDVAPLECSEVYVTESGARVPALATAREVADAMGVDAATIHRWRSRDLIPSGALLAEPPALQPGRVYRTAVLAAAGWLDGPWLRISVAARHLGIGRHALHQRISNGQVPSWAVLCVGGEHRVKQSWIDHATSGPAPQSSE